MELNDRQERLFETFIFFSKMLVAGGVFWAILFIYPDTSGFQAFFASMISHLLRATGFQADAHGFYIVMKEVSYVITQDCLGWKSMAAFTALVFASSGLRENLRPLIGGLTLIAAANVIRVYTTVVLAQAGVISFEVIHGFLWRWGLTFIVLAIWVAWYFDLEEAYKEENAEAH